jgi:hypothetical protein
MRARKKCIVWELYRKQARPTQPKPKKNARRIIHMRAKKALAFAALSAITLLATIPSVDASKLQNDVAKILNRDGLFRKPIIARRAAVPIARYGTITQAAVIGSNAACPAPAAAVVTDACGNPVAATAAPVVSQNYLIDHNGTPLLLSQPAVIAGASTGVAILTPGPSDLDIRRDALEKRINEALVLGQINEAQACDLKAAMSQVKQAEVNWLAMGPLSNEMARRLYRSMDKVNSDLTWYASPNAVRLLGVRMTPSPLWF